MDLIPRSLSILDVGHGNCAVIRDTKGIVVIDTGAGSALLEYLRQERILQIDVLILSHADKDHIGGLVGVLASNEIKVRRICLNPDASKGTASWDDLLFLLNGEDLKGRIQLETSVVRDDSGLYDQGTVHVQIAGPSKYLAGKGISGTDHMGRTIKSNSLSVVVRLLQRGVPLALLPGDLDLIGIESLLAEAIDVKAPIVVFPHHGGAAGSTDSDSFVEVFCKATSPSVLIFSSARGRNKHPSPETIATVRAALPVCRIACTQLSEHCAKNTPELDPSPVLHSYSSGRERRNCCAGSLTLDLDHPEQYFLPSLNTRVLSRLVLQQQCAANQPIP